MHTIPFSTTALTRRLRSLSAGGSAAGDERQLHALHRALIQPAMTAADIGIVHVKKSNANAASHVHVKEFPVLRHICEAFIFKPGQVHFSRLPVVVKKRCLAISCFRRGFRFEPIQLPYLLKRMIRSVFIFKPDQVQSDFIFKTS